MKYYILAFLVFLLIGAGAFSFINRFIQSSSKIQPIESTILETQQEEIQRQQRNIEKDTLAHLQIDTVQYKVIDGHTAINWRTLSFVTFHESYVDSLDAYIPFPDFKPPVTRWEGQPIQIKGYTIPIEETGDESILVLSANPFASCFFCGNAGPETVMDIKLSKKLKKRIKQDDKVTFRGKLRLNDSDFYYLNYILEEAELVE